MAAVGSVKGRLLEMGWRGWKGRTGWSWRERWRAILPVAAYPARRLILYSPIFRVRVLRCMPERIGGLREAAVALSEDARDEALLELVNGIVELDAFVDHFLDEPFEPFGRSLQLPAGQAAERLDVLLARLLHDIVGQRRHRRLLVPADAFEVVADELLVEALLRAARGCSRRAARSATSRASALRRSG